MKTTERKKISEDRTSRVPESTTGRKAKIALLWLLAIWYGALSAQAQTKIDETKKDLVETVADSTVQSRSYKDVVLSRELVQALEADKGLKDWESEQPETKPESPTKFSIETWMWYTVWWKAFFGNRIMWVWKLFKDKKWETNVFTCYDLDDPLHSTGSWKLVLSTGLYKWTSLEWDYTFTGTWSNPARFGLGYGGKLWDGSFKVVAYPLNTNDSPISAKVSFGTNVWKDWRLDSFVFVDFGTKSYYSETEYTHKLAQWIALFAQARLWGKPDGKLNTWDSQTLLWGLKIDIK